MISFLLRCLRSFGKSRALDELPDEVTQAEQLTRFVFQSNHVSWESNRLKPAALLPEPKPGRHGLETSVVRTSALPDAQVWDIGHNTVGRLRGKAPVGRGDFGVEAVTKCQLAVVSDKEHFSRHALLVRWPDGANDKAKRKEIALQLSRYTTAKKPSGD